MLFYFFLMFFDLFKILLTQPSPHGFKVQFIGNTRYVKPEEEQRRNFCNNFWCVNDAFYIFTKSSQYKDSDPCVDFKNFTVGKAWEIDAISDRFIYRGASHLLKEKFWERERRTVSESFNSSTDNRVTKIIKNTFKKCLKSNHTFRHLEAHADAIKYLKSLGGSSYLEKHIAFNPQKFPGNLSEIIWSEKSFDLMKISEAEPKHFLSVFMGLKVTRCDFENLNLICIKIDEKNSWTWREISHESFKTLLEDLEDFYAVGPQFKKILNEKIFDPILENLKNFLTSRDKKIEKWKKTDKKIEKIQVEKLNKIGKINWIKIINNQMFEKLKFTSESLILIDGEIEMIREISKFVFEYEKSSIADIFTFTFLYHHRNSLIVHFYNREEEFNEGRRRSVERWHRCIDFFHSYMRPALYVMYERKRPIFDREKGNFNQFDDKNVKIVESAENFMQEAVTEARKRFIKNSNLPLSVLIEILNKLKTLKIYVGVTNKTLRIDELEEFYDELNLTGDENFFQSVMEMEKFHIKLKNEKGRRRNLDKVVGAEWIKYYIEEGNVLYASLPITIYPAYHPNRPRFFNTATIFYFTIFYLDVGIRRYIDSKFNLTDYVTGLETVDQIAYENYVEWLKTHEDLQIAANYLTNPQLYWVARAFIVFAKFHSNTQKFLSPTEKLMEKYLHIYHKSFPGFQEAFQCKLNGNDFWQIFAGVSEYHDIENQENGYNLLTNHQKVIINKIKVLFRTLAQGSENYDKILQNFLP